jgi:predicted nucleic acid-binding protein
MLHQHRLDRRCDALAAWLGTDLPMCFAEPVVPIDRTVAERWSELMAGSRRSGVARSVMDGFFAATAPAKSLMLVTRNIKDFASLGVPLFNPWNG